ncbi:MAG: RNA polymerase subunit sigma-24 [Opitutia bacterium Tous-C1TDCM]|nr:MAG: RNA polymerase subunit sigma-24 [Opitutae bacterium Tous-C1TDCM]
MKPDDVFPQLVESHYPGLYRFALSLARNPADASDLTQQTFYIWATKGQALRDAGKAKTWLFTTLYREFLRIRRRESRVTALEDLTPAEQDPPDADADVIVKMDAELVLAALQEVPLTFREPLALFYLQELSYLEIADVLEVPIGTIMSRLARGKAHLRALLAQKARGGELIEFPKKSARA